MTALRVKSLPELRIYSQKRGQNILNEKIYATINNIINCFI